eukprot:TRINITY_DN2702_c0_g1_i1.p4 TRINITY_DN2702_c0_g1~~TRINITY_DN2702_c0_g1_i1.p4  ORF type:complete len:142 (-),score=64.73 TRINITY_DN2702_c0_g1_i1:119-544(-)
MVQVADIQSIHAAMAQIFHPGSLSGWVLVGYANDNTVQLQGSGNGGVDELRGHLRADEVQYMLLRLPDKKDDIDTWRDIFIAWTGPSVGKIKAAKKATHVGELQILLSPNHAQLTACNIANFVEPIVRQKALPHAGSHSID